MNYSDPFSSWQNGKIEGVTYELKTQLQRFLNCTVVVWKSRSITSTCYFCHSWYVICKLTLGNLLGNCLIRNFTNRFLCFLFFFLSFIRAVFFNLFWCKVYFSFEKKSCCIQKCIKGEILVCNDVQSLHNFECIFWSKWGRQVWKLQMFS